MSSSPPIRRTLLISALAVALLLLSAPRDSIAAREDAQRIAISSDLRLAVFFGREVELEVAASSGDVESVARRVAAGGIDARTIAAWNGDRTPGPDDWIRVPLELLSDASRALVLRNLFPDDHPDGEAWVHVARRGTLATYDEGLWQVASWFTGDGANFQELMRVNRLDSPELRPGQVLRIPARLLHPAFRQGTRSDDGVLAFGSDRDGPYAAYRLQPGEALYSSVVTRFTGRTGADDVGQIADRLVRRSGIRDPRDIPAHFEIKIPLDLLEPEFLPSGHPRRVEAEARQAALDAALESEPVPRGGLDGVLIVIDPGHGGRDLGTMNNGIWEHDYVYDVACRLREHLEGSTAATVRMTLIDTETGCRPSSGDSLTANRQGTIQTDPPFLAVKDGDAKVGVNLRWYLANSIYREALADGYDRDRVVFVSLHADARHPSLRGVMVYLPGADYRSKTYGSSSARYRTFGEVREKPHVRFPRKQRLRSQAVSQKLAEAIVESFSQNDLPVQPYQPIREKIIRGRSKWVPAVLRGNAVPTKVLVEMVNISNAEDAALLASRVERERLALGLLDALLTHFGEPGSGGAGRLVAD